MSDTIREAAQKVVGKTLRGDPGSLLIAIRELSDVLASQPDQLDQPPAGQEISIDVSTGDADIGNRIFAKLTGECGSGGTWLAEESSRNFSDQPAQDCVNSVPITDHERVLDIATAYMLRPGSFGLYADKPPFYGTVSYDNRIVDFASRILKEHVS